jgi:uncharacterized protein
MIYLDTSLLVTSMTVEASSERVQRWFADQVADTLCTSSWTGTEFSNAVAMKQRRGDLRPDEVVKLLAEWKLVQQRRLVMVPVPDAAFGLAAYYIDLRDFALRSGDALHLAVTSLGGHSLATLDLQLRKAAVAVGVKVEDV